MPNQQTAFCIECGCEKPYAIKCTRETITIRGLTFSYVEMQAYCRCCGEPVYVPEVNDANVQARENGYRKAAKLITVNEINEIIEKYSIGAGPLARLLGFGDVTISRYLAGQLPSKDHSELLLRIRASYKLMDQYLERGKDRITNIAYEKCRAALDEISDLYGSRKIELVARYILCKADDITPLALQKLLYYAQAFFYAIFGETLFVDECQAWSRGPVYPEIYYKYQKYQYNPIERPMDDMATDFSELTTKEITLLDAVIDSFGSYSGTVLRDITHRERPWIEARGNLQPSDRSETVINRNTINEYFRSIVEQYQIVNPCDIGKYCSAIRAKL